MAVALALVFAMAARTPLDSDLWWHLRAGETSWELGRPLLTDLFSHTRYGAAWINHSWLAQVLFYLLYRAGGSLALGAAVALLATIGMGLTYAQMEGHPLLRAFVLVAAVPVAAPLWSARPQLISLALFAALAYLLHRYKQREGGRLWLIVPLFVLWSNLHGGYALGLLLIVAILAGEALNRVLGFEGTQGMPWKGLLRLALWGLAGGLAATFNPNGTAMWSIPFQTVGVGVLKESISEWASPDFHQLAQQPFVWLLLATLGAVGISRKRLDGAELACVAGFAYLALLARRNFAPFALVAAPVLCRHLAAILEEQGVRWAARLEGWRAAGRLLRRDLPAKAFSPGLQRAVNGAILLLLVGAGLAKLGLTASPEQVQAYARQAFPVEAAAWIESRRPAGQLFNAYHWGGYLVWALRDYPVFVDGRTDLYGDEFLQAYRQAYDGQPGWESVLEQYEIRLALTPPDAGLARELARSEAWREAYRDEVAVIFVR